MAGEGAEQRRDHVRVEVRLPVALTWGARRRGGTVVDLSEGGLRAVVNGTEEPAPGQAVEAAFDLDGHPVVVRATAVRADRHDQRRGEVALRFADLPDAVGDRVRRHVFAVQLQQRAQGLR